MIVERERKKKIHLSPRISSALWRLLFKSRQKMTNCFRQILPEQIRWQEPPRIDVHTWDKPTSFIWLKYKKSPKTKRKSEGKAHFPRTLWKFIISQTRWASFGASTLRLQNSTLIRSIRAYSSLSPPTRLPNKCQQWRAFPFRGREWHLKYSVKFSNHGSTCVRNFGPQFHLHNGILQDEGN